MYSFSHFLISSTLLDLYRFCPLLGSSLHEIVPDVSDFIEETSSLSHSIFCYAVFISEGFLISPCYSLGLCIQLAIAFLFFLAFLSLFFFAREFAKPSSDYHFAFLYIFFGGDGFCHCLLYNVIDTCPKFFRHSVYHTSSNEGKNNNKTQS